MATYPSARGKAMRRRILEAALDVIADGGVRKVTHRRVAAQAEASVGLITYYFESTEALIAAALELSVGRDAQRLRSLTDRILQEAGPGVEHIVDLLVDDIAERAFERKREEVISLALTLEIPRFGVPREAFAAWESAQDDLYVGIARRVGSQEPEALGYYLMASVEGLALYAAISTNPSEVEAAARTGLGQLLRSISLSREPESSEPDKTGLEEAEGSHHHPIVWNPLHAELAGGTPSC